MNSNFSIALALIHLRSIIEERIKRSPNPFADISRDSANKNCRVAMENFQRKLTQSENDLKKGGKVAMSAGLKRKLLLVMKKIAEQNCRGKFLRNVGDLTGKGPVGGAGGESHLIFRQTEAHRN